MRILLIDDDEADRMSVRRVLSARAEQTEFVEATSGADAQRLLLGERFDCAVLDYTLPDTNGLEILRRVRGAGVATPVIMLTSQGSEQVAVEMMKAGATDYLSKSSGSMDRLWQSVRAAVRADRAEQAAKRADARLLESEARYGALAETVPQLVWTCAPDGSCDYLNQRWAEYTGMPASEHLGSGWMRALHPDDLDRTAAAWRDAIEGRADYDLEYRLRGADGSYRWFKTRGVPLRDSAGRVIKWFGTCTDIEDQIRTEQRLREETRTIETIQRVGQSLAAELDLRKLVQAVTDAATELSGAEFGAFFYNAIDSRGESHPLYTLSGVDPATFAKFPMPPNTQVFGPTSRGEGPVRLDDVTKDSRYRKNAPYRGMPMGHLPVRSYLAVPVVSRSGQVLGGLFFGHSQPGRFLERHERLVEGIATQAAVAMDNARLHQTEQETRRRLAFLAEASQILSGSLEYEQTVPQVVRMAVPQLGDWVTVQVIDGPDENPRLLAAAHAQREQAAMLEELGKSIAEQPRGSILDDVLRTGWAQLHGEVGDSALVQIAHREGDRSLLRQLNPHSLMVVPLVARGRALGVMTLATAESKHKYDHADLALAEDLARRCASAIDNALLFREAHQARENAEAASRAKDQFLAVLSHELRTPLTPILSTVSMLGADPLVPADLRPEIEMIRRNIELEARLIDDLLDLTRISRGKLQLDVDTIDAHVAITAAIDICREHVLEKDVRLVTELRAATHFVRADPARLQQVFWNLINNAAKFTPKGGTITVRSRNADNRDERSPLIVEVSDTGIGIDSDVLPRIFDAFEQGDSSVTRKFGGLGLGLAISSRLIAMHGGQLRAASAGRGRGATFTVELTTTHPESIGATARSPEPVATELKATIPVLTSNGGTVRILMVDDHEDTSRAMSRLLGGMGYEVRTAGTVQAALDAADHEPFDLLISDIGLPDGSGLELMRVLMTRNAGVKGIALSGFGMEEDVRRSHEAGFREHLTKPINLQKLQQAIEKLTT